MMIFKEIVYQILFFLYLWTYKKKEPMKLSQQSLSIIESAIQKAVAKYTCNCEQTVVTDIHLQPDQTSGQLNIYNDDDEELANIMIEEWATYEGDDFLESVEPSLRNILCRMKDAGAELLLVDDDTILVNDELLKGLDKELDEFLKELLEK